MTDSRVVRADGDITITSDNFQVPYISLVGFNGNIGGLEITNDPDDTSRTLYSEGQDYTIRKLNNDSNDPAVSQVVLTLINANVNDSDTITFFIQNIEVVADDLQFKKQINQKEMQAFNESVMATLAANNQEQRETSDTGDADTLQAAKDYADAEDTKHSAADRAYTNERDNALYQAAQVWANQQDEVHSTNDRNYTDQRDTALFNDYNQQDEQHSLLDRLYTDGEINKLDERLSQEIIDSAGPQGNYEISLYARVLNDADKPAVPSAATYNGTTIGSIPRGWQEEFFGDIDDDTYDYYESFAEYNPSTNTLSDWSAVFVIGAEGATGPAGAKGEKGDKGDKGDPGTDGMDGTDGLDGAPGRDGTDGVSADVRHIVRVVRKEGTAVGDRNYYVENVAEIVQTDEFYIVNPVLAAGDDIPAAHAGKYAIKDANGLITYTLPNEGDTALIYADAQIDEADVNLDVNYIVAILIYEGGTWIITNSFFKNSINCIESGQAANAHGVRNQALGFSSSAAGQDAQARAGGSHAYGFYVTSNVPYGTVLGRQGVVGDHNTLVGIAAGTLLTPEQRLEQKDHNLAWKINRQGECYPKRDYYR